VSDFVATVFLVAEAKHPSTCYPALGGQLARQCMMRDCKQLQVPALPLFLEESSSGCVKCVCLFCCCVSARCGTMTSEPEEYIQLSSAWTTSLIADTQALDAARRALQVVSLALMKGSLLSRTQRVCCVYTTVTTRAAR